MGPISFNNSHNFISLLVNLQADYHYEILETIRD